MYATHSPYTHNLDSQAITDLSAAGYIEKRKLVREADGRRSTLYDQVMAKLEKDAKKDQA